MKIAKFQFSLFGINCYVVWDPATRDCVIIDPGIIDDAEYKALDNFIDKEHLKVNSIINTHLHIDHSLGDSAVAKKYDVKIMAHKLDLPLAENMQKQADMFGLDIKTDAPEVSTFLEDGDTVKVGNGELHVLHVPGHSPGSIVLYDKEDGFLVGGDVLFRQSVGRTDLPGGNHTQLINAIHRKLMSLPSSTVVYPGHGPATTIGDELKHNPFL